VGFDAVSLCLYFILLILLGCREGQRRTVQKAGHPPRATRPKWVKARQDRLDDLIAGTWNAQRKELSEVRKESQG